MKASSRSSTAGLADDQVLARPDDGAPDKITFGEMREMGVRGLLVYCEDYHSSHSIAISADHCLRLEHTSARAAVQRQ